MHRLPAITPGTRYGKITVLGESPVRHAKNGYQYRCQCDCGKVIDYLPCELKRGRYSCGCSTRERQQAGQLTHGESRIRGVRDGTPEYRTWRNMITRCTNPRIAQYKDYGGRGITVCEAWKQSFECFVRDVGRKPTPKHSIERIDNNGPYAPGNCRWATRAEQMVNRRETLWIIENGERIPAKTWAERERVKYRTMHGIFSRLRVQTLAVHDVPLSMSTSA